MKNPPAGSRARAPRQCPAAVLLMLGAIAIADELLSQRSLGG